MISSGDTKIQPLRDEILKESSENELEVSRWNSRRDQAFGETNVWLKDGSSIESKVPPKSP